MSKEKLYKYDTPLRAGAQEQSVDFSYHAKVKIDKSLE